MQDFWAETIDAISLTQEQTEKILHLASMLVKSIKSCHSQREVLSRKLTALLPQTCGTSGDVGAACASTDIMNELRRYVAPYLLSLWQLCFELEVCWSSGMCESLNRISGPAKVE